jgi:hypothetical protein
MTSSGLDRATEKALSTIDDPGVERRYPNRTHFIAADNPHHGEMATKALFAGDPVTLVYPDGRELLITPSHARGLAGLLLVLAAAWLRLRSSSTRGNVVQLPPRTRIEARDSSGLPEAA